MGMGEMAGMKLHRNRPRQFDVATGLRKLNVSNRETLFELKMYVAVVQSLSRLLTGTSCLESTIVLIRKECLSHTLDYHIA